MKNFKLFIKILGCSLFSFIAFSSVISGISNHYITKNSSEVEGVDVIPFSPNQPSSEIIVPEITPQETEETDASAQVSDTDWALFLIDKNNALDENYAESITLSEFNGYDGRSLSVDSRIYPYLIDMIDAATEDNITLNVISAYRTFEYQKDNFDKNVNERVEAGMLYTEAYAEVYNIIALPGQSEHNSGLAVDILSDEYLELDEAFENTEAFKWLSENAYKFGFILSYPKDKTDITGFIYEPWHYRFVGKNHAELIHDNNYTLKEYLQD